ncbi:MAG: PAS domain S-box protein, partial [Planctomycetota bacterium]
AEAMRVQAEEEIREKNSILQLIHKITIAANEALTVDDAMLICLEKICQYAGWPVGHVYQPVENHNGSLLLKPSHLWYFKEPEKFVNLKKVTDIANFKPGEGLPGRVYKTRRPAWIPDVTTDSDFPRAQYARDKNLDIGIRGALAFPIMEGSKVVSVLEFFSEKIVKTREIVIEVVADIAIQIGRVTERKRTEESLRKLSQAVDQSTISVLITDTDGKIEYVNPKFIQMTGYDREEIIGQNPRILKSGETSSVEYQRLWEKIVSGKEWQGEFQNKKKNGEMYWERASISPIKNDKGEITHFLGIKEDITEHKKSETKLLYMADHDPLTNLLNRRRFREELEYWTALSLRHDYSGALLFLDIDDFKHINDTLGHQVGDELLVCIADMLRGRLRETDILARQGGD